MADAIALYLHFPFCRSRCRYCSFVSFSGCDEKIDRYVEALEREIRLRSAGGTVGSIYFGGGTPSLVPIPLLDRLMGTIRNVFDVQGDAEITLESNPGTVDAGFFSAVRDIGFNRLSLGAQSFDDRILSVLGRVHQSSEIVDAFGFARDADFSNINLDLIYGVPGQSLSGWRDTLDRAVSLGPNHLSLYPLTLESETPMFGMIEAGELSPLDADLAAEQYELAQDFLVASGYTQYEISNWARLGYECRHNTVYWRCEPYLGLGVAAHSFMGNRRQSNTGDLDDYLAMFSPGGNYRSEVSEALSLETQLSDFLMMGLRMNCGVSIAEIKTRFGVDFLSRYQEEIDELLGLGLIEIDDRSVWLTRRGRLLGNEVFLRFIP